MIRWPALAGPADGARAAEKTAEKQDGTCLEDGKEDGKEAAAAAAVAVAVVVVVVVVVVVRTWETRLLMERRATCRCPGRLKHSNVYTSESKTYPRQKCGDEVVMYTKYTV